MAKEIIITNACNKGKFICFKLNGLEDGILVGIPDIPNCITICYKGETKVVPLDAKTKDLEELNSDENAIRPSRLKAFDKFIQDIYNNKVDTEKVEACKKIFEGIDKIDVEVDDDRMKCPFCQQELDYLAEDIYGNMYCPNCRDKNGFTYKASESIWQELTKTKQALDVAISALTVIGEGLVIEHSVVGHEDDNKMLVAKQTLDQIKQIVGE